MIFFIEILAVAPIIAGLSAVVGCLLNAGDIDRERNE